MKIDLEKIDIATASKALQSGEFSSVQLTEAYIQEIGKKNPEINAYLEVFDDAIISAKEADLKIGAGKKNPLLGIPFAVKDNILIKDKIASASSKILENYRATYDATVIQKLKNAGAVILGRTNMDEFAMGGSTENSAFGPTKNPHDISRVAGGSSGGSAAAVAMNGALFALGSDTGGSIREPASFCGVVGLKPTYGAVSRYGLMAMGSSLDQIGPITKTVADAKIVFDAIKGKDPLDGTTVDMSTEVSPRYAALGGRFAESSTEVTPRYPRKMKIGVPRHFLGGDGIDKDVMKTFEQSLEVFKTSGHEIVDIELPNIAYALTVYYIVMPAEVSANMARFDGIKYGLRVEGKDSIESYFKTRRAGLGREVKRRILLGTYVLSSGYYDAYYNRANALRDIITNDFREAFKKVDAIATPVAPSPAFKIGEKTNDPISMYLEDIFTVTANLTGMPAISVPVGSAVRDGKSLPIGLQLAATHGGEETLFYLASIPK